MQSYFLSSIFHKLYVNLKKIPACGNNYEGRMIKGWGGARKKLAESQRDDGKSGKRGHSKRAKVAKRQVES